MATKKKKVAVSEPKKHIFEFFYSGDGIERQRAYFEGTSKDALDYSDELARRGYVDIKFGPYFKREQA